MCRGQLSIFSSSFFLRLYVEVVWVNVHDWVSVKGSVSINQAVQLEDMELYSSQTSTLPKGIIFIVQLNLQTLPVSP